MSQRVLWLELPSRLCDHNSHRKCQCYGIGVVLAYKPRTSTSASSLPGNDARSGPALPFVERYTSTEGRKPHLIPICRPARRSLTCTHAVGGRRRGGVSSLGSRGQGGRAISPRRERGRRRGEWRSTFKIRSSSPRSRSCHGGGFTTNRGRGAQKPLSSRNCEPGGKTGAGCFWRGRAPSPRGYSWRSSEASGSRRAPKRPTIAHSGPSLGPKTALIAASLALHRDKGSTGTVRARKLRGRALAARSLAPAEDGFWCRGYSNRCLGRAVPAQVRAAHKRDAAPVLGEVPGRPRTVT
eukprot:scaffold1860_cov403-Prasinococcus_capsulatus_cf.AAC.14